MIATRPVLHRALAVTACAAALLVAACGGDDGGATAATPTDPALAGTAGAGTEAAPAYPVTIEHANGTTVIERPPERIVTVGATDETVLLAFGTKAVGYATWYGDGLDLSWPWSKDLWGADGPEPVSNDEREIDLESVAALEPDLILGLWAGVDDARYEQYSNIAPTVILGTVDQQTVDYRDATRMAGRVLGRPDRAEELIAGVEDGFAAVAAAHPGLAGRTAAFVAPESDGTIFAYAPEDGRGVFLSNLGFVADEALAGEFEDGSAILQVSNERYDVFDGVDCLFVSIYDEAIEASLAADALYASIPAVRDGCVVELRDFGDDPPISAGIATNNPLGLRYAIERVSALLDDVTVPS